MPIGATEFNRRQYMLKGDYEIFRYRDRYLKDVQLHHHDYYEVYCFLSGNVSYTVESRSYRLLPGDVLVLSPLELHQPIVDASGEAYERYVLWVNPSYLEALSSKQTNLSDCFDTKRGGHVNLLRGNETENRRIAALFQQLLEETNEYRYGSDLLCRQLLCELLVAINRLALRAGEGAPLPAISNPHVETVLRHINEHIGEELRLDDLAALVYMNKSTLLRCFRRMVGTSVYHYILQKRLLVSRQLILEGKSVTKAAGYCGFHDYSSFFRAFCKEYGMSPKDFAQGAKLQAQ